MYLYGQLKTVPETIPECFKDKYSNTRVIIDCTELLCLKLSSLSIQSSLFSHYKHHISYKDLIGISPSGVIKFISELYYGFTFDVEIVKRLTF